MKNRIIVFLLVVTLFVTGVLMSAVGSVSAISITQTKSWGLQTPNYTKNLTFDQFDSSLGTLNSIQVKLFLTSEGGSFSMDNDHTSDAVSNYNVTFGSAGDLDMTTEVSLLNASASPVVGTVSALNSSSFNLAADDGDGVIDDYTGPDGAVFSGGNVNTSNFGFIDPTLFNAGTKGFIGTSTYDIIADITQTLNHTSNSDVTTLFSANQSQGNVEITYEYTANTVPEPTTVALLGIGLAGFAGAVIRKRLKKQKQ